MGVDNFIILFIYSLSFLMSVSCLRYEITRTNIWNTIIYISAGIIIILGLGLIILYTRLRYFCPLSIHLVLLVVYEITISLVYRSPHYKEMMLDILTWPILIIVFLEYSTRYRLPRCFYLVTQIGFFLNCALAVFNVNEHLHGNRRGGAVIFYVYFLIGQVALIMCIQNKKLNILAIIIVLSIVTASTKRAGSLAIAGGAIVYLTIDALITDSPKESLKKLAGYMVFALTTIIVGYYLIIISGSTVLDRMNNISEDEGSGRIGIWENVFNAFNRSDWFEKLLGHGFHAVFYKLHPFDKWHYSFAHNSYIETLYDYGIVGETLLILLVFAIIISCAKQILRKMKTAPALAYTIIPMIMLSMFSYFFEQTRVIIPFAISWGILIGGNNIAAPSNSCSIDKNKYLGNSSICSYLK